MQTIRLFNPLKILIRTFNLNASVGNRFFYYMFRQDNS